MKKSKLIPALVLASTFALTGCGEEPGADEGGQTGGQTTECSHVDANHDHVCDLCEETFSQHDLKWKYDETQHWKECSFEGCDHVTEKENHEFGEWSEKSPASFDSAGEEHCTCECGAEETRPIPILEHQFAEAWSHDDEKHWHACSDEGYETLLKTDEGAHDFTAWSVSIPASFESNGEEQRVCKVCGRVETRVITKSGHTFSKDLFQGEETHYYKCLDEGFETYKEDEEPHNFPDQWETVTEATYEHAGLEHKICSDCGKEITRPIEQLAHQFNTSFESDDFSHWHACADEGFKSLITEKESHVDEDKNGVCDVCGETLNVGEVTAIDLVMPITYIGRLESTIVTANLTKTGFCDDELVWSISDSEGGTPIEDGNIVIEQIDNYSIKVTNNIPTSPDKGYARYITVSLKNNSSIKDSAYIQGWNFNSTRYATLKSFMGTDYLIPYNYAFRPSGSGVFDTSGNRCSAFANTTYSASKVDAYNGFLQGFRNNSKFVESKGTATDEYIFTLTGTKNVYEFHVDKDDTYTYLDVYKLDLPVVPVEQLSEFPMDVAMKNVRGLIACDIIAPVGPNTFEVSDTTIKVYGTAADYIAQLTEAGYVTKKSGTKTTCASPDGTLKVVVDDKTSTYTLDFTAVSKPAQFDWLEEEKQMMRNFIGEVLPFVNAGYVWEDYSGYGELDASSSLLGARELMIAALEAEETFTKEEAGNYVNFVKPISKFTEVVVSISNSGSVAVIKRDRTLTTWLKEDVAAHLDIELDMLPELSGTLFKYDFSTEEMVDVVTDADFETYKSALESTGLLTWTTTNFIGATTGYGATTVDGTLSILMTLSSETIRITKKAAPEGEDWSDTSKQLMIDYMGEVLPFIKADFAEWTHYSAGDYLYTSSSRTGAPYIAKYVMDQQADFVAGEDASGAFTYTKAFDKFADLVVTINTSSSTYEQIKISKAVKKLTTWEAEDIAAALGSDAQEALPSAVAEGNTMQYSLGENKVVIDVMNDTASTIMAYQDALIAASFTGEASASGGTFKSPTDTLTVVVSKVSNKKFTITATGHLPEGQYRELPLNTIAKDLANDPGLLDLPLPEGTLFFYEKNDHCDVTVTVLTGGSKTTYETALVEAGFALDQGVYSKGNVLITVTAGDGDVYSAKLTLAVKPVAGWTDEIKEVINAIAEYQWASFTADDLPYPTDAESVQKVSNKSFKVSGIDMTAYKTQLEEAGFSVSYYSYNGEYDVYYGDDYYALYIMDQYDGSYLFTYTYY